MALKFLNKKGWHTGSLRNIENVWKAEQKHDAEQKKLEELRKQIHEEREKSEYRQLQEAAGLIPRQERLDFLYESGLGVGKGSSEGFKALQEQPSAGAPSSAAESSSSKAAVPGALFEEKEKPQSANDAWRKLHSDPLLLIRQREQEALARIKNNPIRMAMIRKSVESEKKREDKEHKKKKKKHKRDKSKSKVEDASKSQPDSDNFSGYEARRRRDYPVEWKRRSSRDTIENGRNDNKGDTRKANNAVEQHEKPSERHEKQLSTRSAHCDERSNEDYKSVRHKRSEQSKSSSKHRSADKYDGQHKHKVSGRRENDAKMTHSSAANQLPATNKDTYPKNAAQQSSGYNRRHGVPKMTEEEREARLREMQMDAELHEGQRWKRLKTATAADVLEAAQAATSRGKNFLDAAQKSVYGMEKGGSTTIEESVRRRTYYSQGQSAHDSNAFRR